MPGSSSALPSYFLVSMDTVIASNGWATPGRERQVFLVAVIVNELCKVEPLTAVTATITYTIFLTDKISCMSAKM